MENSDALKARILEMGGAASDDGMQADSSGYSTEETIELDDDQEEGEVESSEDEEGEEPTADEILRELQGKKEADILSRMDAQQRSTYAQTKRLQQQKELSEYLDGFDKDVRETGLELQEFPLVSRQFNEEYSLGKVKFPSNEQIAASESPTMEIFTNWLSANQPKVLKLLERENPSEPSYERLGKLINTIQKAPPIGARVRDKMFGFDKPQGKKMTDREIKEAIESYFNGEGDR